MHTVIRTIRRPPGVRGTDSRLVAVAGRYLFPAVEADTLAASLATRDHDLYPRPRYDVRQVYLPACDTHAEHQPGCPACGLAMETWLEELREHATDRTDPAAISR